ncbi:uncharacterized protein MYCFIDRAFT_179155 [Pseudocercospora fijiensis CIRAD86]|uniref:Uncharacterized protein n=1 Tax=Pseudocercospora fijiensis (strain CIRAD86) TaxID=383855 RepID=M3AKH1_PSEFD|nr:uncharacterized protein MYCFIDRAFT_179155 [Pseudocercospora fijiensis CIRAD86]EME77658.1 hypothetical protein MYCFIDRAFT_179155 [Pseudocercospora fijiensis CIRAD86]
MTVITIRELLLNRGSGRRATAMVGASNSSGVVSSLSFKRRTQHPEFWYLTGTFDGMIVVGTRSEESIRIESMYDDPRWQWMAWEGWVGRVYAGNRLWYAPLFGMLRGVCVRRWKDYNDKCCMSCWKSKYMPTTMPGFPATEVIVDASDINI